MVFVSDDSVKLNGVTYDRIKYILTRDGQSSYSVSLSRYGWSEVQRLIDAMGGQGLTCVGIRVTDSQEIAEAFFADRKPRKVSGRFKATVAGEVSERRLLGMLSHRDFDNFELSDFEIEDFQSDD